ncbi:2-polyprenyl-6-hydroxyphenyl methylase / 3-demethylubiquinone-9 3-methyltransferase [Dyella jiangningensis]|uniref:class I SAM-dependent methyltransferase n=1 Tax=Dyella sp. AtDHG13 TaxID=1938897 RepID=UPI00088E6EB3|nr:class I SAM-dependent methyltransferase [Dyella sp. AtDHG13]PXV58205.1 2-polyprenyl-6-hydroxyphenyl methylase/3-demethylubiquinone-9 3-methyltransferase [Dyella sp. AtDHG13]SDK11975.1 2-polyprenyl-6-hydroxyphenyl methylase / 3-demethylubiquinone-9 3-methyltransferase [Dyella jiangningensis]
MRFAFGKNWRSFLSLLDDHRIDQSRVAISKLLDRENLQDWRVLDIGSGSGLSSLAMYQLGAEVVSFDYDSDSVSCTQELHQLYGADDKRWTVMRGSVLDPAFMESLGTFDLVYSWGVLHHTGAMWTAVDLAQQGVTPNGILLIALYNDQGMRSRIWRGIKRFYCSSTLGRWLVKATFFPLFGFYTLALDIRQGELPGNHIRNYPRRRGMSITHDWSDWLGGYPFEVAKPEDVVNRLSTKGFELQRHVLTHGLGCNEFVFKRRG